MGDSRPALKRSSSGGGRAPRQGRRASGSSLLEMPARPAGRDGVSALLVLVLVLVLEVLVVLVEVLIIVVIVLVVVVDVLIVVVVVVLVVIVLVGVQLGQVLALQGGGEAE